MQIGLPPPALRRRVRKGIGSAFFLFAASSMAWLHGAGMQLDWQQLVSQAENEYEAGRMESSRDLFLQALSRVKTESQRAFTFNRLGLAYVDLGDPATALPYYTKAIAILRQTGDSTGGNMAEVVSNLSVLYYNIEQYAKAEGLCREALALRHRHFGPSHPDVALSWQNLAAIQQTTGKTRDALESFRKALETFNGLETPDPPAVAMVRSNMAVLYLELGQDAPALEEATAAIGQARTIWTDQHPVVGRMKMVRGSVLLLQNRLAEAGIEFREALSICESALGAHHPHVGEILRHYAQVMRKTGRKKEAKQMEARARSITELARNTSLLGHTVDVSTLRRGSAGGR